jgi:hypothetical protein
MRKIHLKALIGGKSDSGKQKREGGDLASIRSTADKSLWKAHHHKPTGALVLIGGWLCRENGESSTAGGTDDAASNGGTSC